MKSFLFATILCFAAVFSPVFNGVYAADDLVASIEKRQRELKDREDALKVKEDRLNALRKDVDEKIDKYTKLLAQIETALKKIEKVKDDRYEHIVKTFEAMPPEEAAPRLSSVDEGLAITILSRMKSKRAAAIMGAMEPKKASTLTEGLARIEKNFPTR